MTIKSKFKEIKMKKSIFYHAVCSVFVSAEHDIVKLVGAEIVDIILAENRESIADAEKAGVKSVPAMVTSTGNVIISSSELHMTCLSKV